ncbi:MAG: DUF3276 family protein [Candidatus Nealsonbacteria bacterium]|nr:DUF3276 family protein [Candidatus Nealsonbacteria bacterium]
MSADFKEVMSVRVDAGSRTLYVDLKENPDGSKFLSISEVKRHGHEARSRILIDQEYVPELFRALCAVVEFLAPKGEPKSYSVEQKRQMDPRAYEPWTEKEQQRLKEGFARGVSVEQLAQEHGRGPTAIRRRLERLGLSSRPG